MPTRGERSIMKLLKIDKKKKGLFLRGENWVSIADMEENDLVSLIEVVANSEEAIELDECDTERAIGNPIERTIYEEVYKVLRELDDNREAYLAECEDTLDELERSYGLECLAVQNDMNEV